MTIYRILVDGRIVQCVPNKLELSGLGHYFDAYDFHGADMAEGSVYEWRFKSRFQQPEQHPDGSFKPFL